MEDKKIIDALNWRYATKQFDSSKKIKPEHLKTLKEATRLTASSFGLQPFKVVHVKDPQLRAKMREASWNQSQVTDASEVFVFAARTDLSPQYIQEYVKLIAQTRGIPLESLKMYQDMMLGFEKGLSQEQKIIWAQKQAYISLGNLLTVAALLGIDTCPMEGFDPAKVTQLLELDKQNLVATLICPIGYRAQEDKSAQYKKVRFSEKDFFVTK